MDRHRNGGRGARTQKDAGLCTSRSCALGSGSAHAFIKRPAAPGVSAGSRWSPVRIPVQERPFFGYALYPTSERLLAVPEKTDW